jgi:hypothetical protein
MNHFTRSVRDDYICEVKSVTDNLTQQITSDSDVHCVSGASSCMSFVLQFQPNSYHQEVCYGY